ncbi:MAG: hypothetical protein J0M02_05445, partial [Planctomycetes bacterium]|nr:hypothetical protein [Planctomycetota bacterium]
MLLLAAVLGTAEPLVCRGFDAATAANALTAQGGTLLRLDPALRAAPVWFFLPEAGSDSARQTLAHAVGCWWSGSWLTTARETPVGEADVRTYPPLPARPPQAEDLVRGLMRPWLSGDGGLVLDAQSGIWTVTTSPRGHAQAELILAAISDPHPRAP